MRWARRAACTVMIGGRRNSQGLSRVSVCPCVRVLSGGGGAHVPGERTRMPGREVGSARMPLQSPLPPLVLPPSHLHVVARHEEAPPVLLLLLLAPEVGDDDRVGPVLRRGHHVGVAVPMIPMSIIDEHADAWQAAQHPHHTLRPPLTSSAPSSAAAAGRAWRAGSTAGRRRRPVGVAATPNVR